jgi:integrase/recombinase XerD
MKRKNPAKSYLLSLASPQSRVSMQSYVLRALDILQPGSDLRSFDWASLTHDSLNTLRDVLKEEGKAPATINAYIAAMKGVAKETWRQKYINVEIYQHIKEVKRYKGRREPSGRALTLEELNSILDHCMAQEGPISVRDAALIALVYGAGLRRAEAANLPLAAYKRKAHLRDRVVVKPAFKLFAEHLHLGKINHRIQKLFLFL